MNESGMSGNSELNERSGELVNVPSCEVSIDIGQVLAANQSLLKKMAGKVESLEKKISCMQIAFEKQNELLETESKRSVLLLTTSAKETRPWEPKKPRLDDSYYSRFSIADRLFRPWIMRRKDN